MGYKNPFARDARRFRLSRDTWRARAADKQKEIRALRVKIRDLTNSRDRWKDDVQLLKAQIEQLQAKVDSLQAELRLGGVKARQHPKH